MKAGSAAKRYARAAFSLGEESGNFEKIGQELSAVASAMGSDGSLRDILTNPLHDNSIRRNLVIGLAEKMGMDVICKNLLLLLVDKGRGELIPDIAESYRGLSDAKAGRVQATVVTAAKVSDGVLSEMAAAIGRQTNKKVSLSSEIDPSLIGGVVVRVGDLVFDGSIRTQLHKIKDSISKSI